MTVNMTILDLQELETNPHPGVTPRLGACLAEAAAVLFEHNSHKAGVAMSITGDSTCSCNVVWGQLHPNANRAYNDLQSSVEHAAYGIAILLVPKLTHYIVIERSRKKTGFDYHLMKKNTGSFTLKRDAGLEISGIINDAKAVDGRVKGKLKQTMRSPSTPSFVAVIEFGSPLSVIQKR